MIWKSSLDRFNLIFYSRNPSKPILEVLAPEGREFAIPKIQVFCRLESLSYLFEEGVSLSDHFIICSFHWSKLSKCSLQNTIDILSSMSRRKVEKIHIERREKNRTKREVFHIFYSGNFFSLNKKLFSSTLSKKSVGVIESVFRILERGGVRMFRALRPI